MLRYTYDEIQKFLKESNNDVDAAFNQIRFDMDWRSKNIPVLIEDLKRVWSMKNIFVFGRDINGRYVVYVNW